MQCLIFQLIYLSQFLSWFPCIVSYYIYKVISFYLILNFNVASPLFFTWPPINAIETIVVIHWDSP